MAIDQRPPKSTETVRPIGEPGRIFDQFYDRENHKVRIAGIIGAIILGIAGGHAVASLGANTFMTALGAFVAGGVGAWLGNRASDSLSHFGAAKKPEFTPTQPAQDSPAQSNDLTVNNQPVNQPEISVPAGLPIKPTPLAQKGAIPAK